MFNYLHLTLFLVCLIIPGQATSQNYELLSKIDFSKADIKFSIDDQVQDGCFTNANSARNQLEAELRRNNFIISKAEIPAAVYITFTVVGQGLHRESGTKAGCHANWEFHVEIIGYAASTASNTELEKVVFDGEVVTISVWENSGIIVSSDDLQPEIEGQITESVRDFYLETQRARNP